MDVLISYFNNNIGDPLVKFINIFSFLGSLTYVFKVPYLDTLLEYYVCSVLQAPLPIIKYAVSLFLVYPFAGLLRLIPFRYDSIRHLYCFIIGLLLLQWTYGEDWIHSIISSMITYLICLNCPKKYVAATVFIWAMGYMIIAHWYRMYTSYMTFIFDFTGTQMVLTMKLTSFAYNYYDGTYDYKNVSKKDDDRKRYAITKLPSLLQFMGYIYCFTCLQAGPAFEYNDYVHVIDGSIFIKKSKDNKIVSSSPSTIIPGLRRLLVGVIALVFHVILKGSYPLLTERDGKLIPTLSDTVFIANNSIIKRLCYMMIALLSERYKFYFAWKVAEGSCILAGFGFEGYDKFGEIIGFAGVENVDIMRFGLSWNLSSMSRAWNKRTQKWLERYTYSRTGNNLSITYFVSAIWHGLYPGYFFFFMTLPLVASIERLIRSKINPIIIPSYNFKDPNSYPYDLNGVLYAIFGFISYITVMKYVAQTFNLGTISNCHKALSSYHYGGHILLIFIYIFLLILPTGNKKKNS